MNILSQIPSQRQHPFIQIVPLAAYQSIRQALAPHYIIITEPPFALKIVPAVLLVQQTSTKSPRGAAQ